MQSCSGRTIEKIFARFSCAAAEWREPPPPPITCMYGSMSWGPFPTNSAFFNPAKASPGGRLPLSVPQIFFSHYREVRDFITFLSSTANPVLVSQIFVAARINCSAIPSSYRSTTP